MTTNPLTYRTIHIWRNTEPGYQLPYTAYVNNHFVSADTLDGIRRMIDSVLDRTR